MLNQSSPHSLTSSLLVWEHHESSIPITERNSTTTRSRRWLKLFGIHHFFTPLYHPQATPVERTNRVLKTMIRSFIEQDHRDWDVHINDFRFAYNSSLHSTNKTTPAYLNLGRELLPRSSGGGGRSTRP